MNLAYEPDRVRGVDCTEVGGESETALVERAWSRRALDQRMDIRKGRTPGWP